MVNPEFLGRLGRLAKWHGGGLAFDLGGATGPISVTCPGVPILLSLVCSCRCGDRTEKNRD